MSAPVYVVGHRNPDTDSISSAIGYAAFKQATGTASATPARLGELWPETKYLLDRFGVPAPELIEDVYTRVRDVMNVEPQYVTADATMQDVGAIMRDKRLVPVVDRERRLVGAVTLDDVAARYLEEMDLAAGLQSRISYQSMVRTLQGELVSGDPDGMWEGRVWVAEMEDVTLAELVRPGDLVVVGEREPTQLTAIRAGASCLVLSGGSRPGEVVLREACERGVRLIVTPHHAYRITRLLNLSVPVSEVMDRTPNTIEEDDLVTEAEEHLAERGTIALLVLDAQRRLVGVLSRSDLLRARGRPIILVDHNHSTQAVQGLSSAQLLEVIDHHNLGDLHTPEPIYMKLEPVGSTCTIVAEMYQQAGLSPEPRVAGVLLGGVISDTLLFRSPTCTPRDRAAGVWLTRIADIDPEELGQAMFRANSDYEHTTPERILSANLKVYEWGGQTVAIGQAETVDLDYFTNHKVEMLAAMQDLKSHEDYDYLLFLATGILTQDSLVFIPGDAERQLVERAFGVEGQDGVARLPGVVSRKKQVVPPLARALG